MKNGKEKRRKIHKNGGTNKFAGGKIESQRWKGGGIIKITIYISLCKSLLLPHFVSHFRVNNF